MADVLDQLLDLDRSQLEPSELRELNSQEMREWLESLDYVLASGRPERREASRDALEAPEQQPEYPGDLDIEKRITNMIRWNAMAMVVHANTESPGIGGHIATYASAANLYEVAQHHFFRGPEKGPDADLVYFQGHATPGFY